MIPCVIPLRSTPSALSVLALLCIRLLCAYLCASASLRGTHILYSLGAGFHSSIFFRSEIYPFRALRSSVTLHPSSLRLPLRLCVSAGNSHSLLSRSRLPLQYLFPI